MSREKAIVEMKIKKKISAERIVDLIAVGWKPLMLRTKRQTLTYEKVYPRKVKAKWTVSNDRILRLYQKIEIPPKWVGNKLFEKRVLLNKKYMVIRTLVSAGLMKHPTKLRRELYEIDKKLFPKKKTTVSI